MRSTLDSIDICQSVMANFFVRAAAGQFDIQSPDQLLRLLITMAKNKITDHARRAHAARRDTRKRDPSGADKLDAVAAAVQTPSEIVANADLLRRFLDLLTPEERRLAERWSEGVSWSDLAAEMNDSSEALRKRLSRAIDRAAKDLGLDEVGDA
jgi:RNA polymerase sigma-70 factor (ECF subfamily)